MGRDFGKDEGYYAGKAGKDLFDAAHVFAHHVDAKSVLALCEEFGLRDDVEPRLRAPDRNVRDVALGLAKAPATRAWILENPS